MAIPKFDPRTKLVWYILMIYFSLNSQTVEELSFTLMVCIISSLILTRSFKQYKAMVMILLLLGLQILIVQVLFCREGVLIYRWSILKIYSDALPLAITGLLKATLIFYASFQFFTSSTAQEFTLMLMKFKIPYRFAMLVGLGVRFLPLMKDEYASIIDSQQTRGLRMNNVWDDLKAIIPTFLPFLYRAVRRSTEIALAMELRGYGRSKSRTFSSDLAMKYYDISIIAAMLMVISLSLIERLLPFI
jgi:energy-coupling factor transport system permease protein